MEQPVPLKDIFTVAEFGEENNKKKKWTPIGIGFVNKDGSINVILDAFPTNGRLQVRDRTPRKTDNLTNPKQGD